MKVESRVFSLSWVPSDVVSGISRLPFAISIARADTPPPDRVDNPHALVGADAARQTNDLRGWAEFDEQGRPTDFGYDLSAPGGWAQLEFPELRREPKVQDHAVRFVQTSGGRLGGSLEEGTMLVGQGDRDDTVFLVLDGVLDVEVGGKVIAEVGPGAVVGERASLEGRRTATLRTRTVCRVAALDPSSLSAAEREQLAVAHRHEDD